MNGKHVRAASKIIRAASAALAAFTLFSAAQLRAAAADGMLTNIPARREKRSFSQPVFQ